MSAWDNLLALANGNQIKIEQWKGYMDKVCTDSKLTRYLTIKKILANFKTVSLCNVDDDETSDMDFFIFRAILNFPQVLYTLF